MAKEGSVPTFKDVIVAIHGIGPQSRFSTIRSVATRLAASKTLLQSSTEAHVVPVAPQPLGFFHTQRVDITSVCHLDDPSVLGDTALASIGFAEVFWADIPEKVVSEGSTLEETKAWGRTVVARAHALWLRAARDSGVPPDFGLAAEVLDEIIETIYVLENLFFLAGKAGLFRFNLRQVLEDYLGDVQIVTEFSEYRSDIVARFHKAMNDVYRAQKENGNSEVRLHIIAHSEGTVISFLGLLQAMSGQELKVPSSPSDRPELQETGRIPEWIKHVHGYMTIGSPIDKHLLLWPRLWEKLNPSFANTMLDEGQIQWRNYYDFGDPIGFELDTAREWLDQKNARAFQFCDCAIHQHDIGFARYLLPGKAHSDYWNDPNVFEHFVDDVIRSPKDGNHLPRRPKDKVIIPWLSPALPYILSFAILVLGVFLLYGAVDRFVYPNDPPTNYSLISAIGVTRTSSVSPWRLFLNTLGISGLIAGTTLYTRFPRLAAGKPWKISGIIAFGIGSLSYASLVAAQSRSEIGSLFRGLGRYGPTVGVLCLALIAGILGRTATRPVQLGHEDRRQRWIFKGMRPFILCGAVAVAVIVGTQIFRQELGYTELSNTERSILTRSQIDLIEAAGFDRRELDQLFQGRPESLKNLAVVKPFLTARPPLWPVLLATAGFLYLWWLAALIFDLGFVWQRYIRHSIANQRLREWRTESLRQSGPGLNQPKRCRHPTTTIGGN